ncbi:fimbrial chaperone BcfG [Salmonella enterica subsp. enterica serovar Choleraesuis]|nr:fimbrial chaperone BcfG [Salmonella enterica subsp. enterica serovar Choleraesuis]
MNKRLAAFGLMLMLTANISLADGFGINATRVILKQGNDSTTVTLRNTSAQQSYIVQSRMSQTVDGFEQTPFIITPPIFRLDPESTNNLRIRLNGSSSLAQDRESVFYLNTRAIPASTQQGPTGNDKSISGTAQFGVGTIIKLFYRPKGLTGSAEDAQEKLSFMASPRGIRVINNAPYYVSFANLTVDGESLLQRNAPAMLAPFSEYVYPTSHKRGKVAWSTINDFGGINAHTTTL